MTLGLVFAAGTLASIVLTASQSSVCHEPLFNLVARMGLPNVVDAVEFERRVQCLAMAAFVLVLVVAHRDPSVGAHVLFVPAALAAQCFYVAGDTCQGSVVPLDDDLDRLLLLFARFSIAGAQLPLDAVTLVMAWAGMCLWRGKNTVPHRALAVCYIVLSVFYALYMRRIPPSNTLASLGIAHMTSRTDTSGESNDDGTVASDDGAVPRDLDDGDGKRDVRATGLYRVAHASTVPGAVGELVPVTDHIHSDSDAMGRDSIFTITDTDHTATADNSD